MRNLFRIQFLKTVPRLTNYHAHFEHKPTIEKLPVLYSFDILLLILKVFKNEKFRRCLEQMDDEQTWGLHQTLIAPLDTSCLDDSHERGKQALVQKITKVLRLYEINPEELVFLVNSHNGRWKDVGNCDNCDSHIASIAKETKLKLRALLRKARKAFNKTEVKTLEKTVQLLSNLQESNRGAYIKELILPHRLTLTSIPIVIRQSKQQKPQLIRRSSFINRLAIVKSAQDTKIYIPITRSIFANSDNAKLQIRIRETIYANNLVPTLRRKSKKIISKFVDTSSTATCSSNIPKTWTRLLSVTKTTHHRISHQIKVTVEHPKT